MAVRKKILFVTYGLQKAGSEKYLYELVTNMSKEKFDIEVLASNNVRSDKVFPHYYYNQLKKQQVKVHTLFHTYKKVEFDKNKITGRIFLKLEKILRLKGIYHHLFYKRRILNLLKKFDAVILIDALYFFLIKDFITDDYYFETHLMCHQAQFDPNFEIYSNYNKNHNYNFVYIDKKQILELESQGIKCKNSYYFPLSIKLEELNNEYKVSNNPDEVNIGIYTRINRIKPIDKLIDAFGHFNSLYPDSRLKIFGKVQEPDYYAELCDKIQSMKLENKVFFLGHVNNMIESAKDENITLVWVVSIFQFIGYAGLELCLNNVPVVLNNIDAGSDKELDNADIIPPYFYDEVKLANYTYDIIKKDKIGELLNIEKRKYIKENNLKVNISKYENYLTDVLREY
ncbi:glycosyltransferase [Elizabethkingia meningoseptica]|uniref:glycosyltransferase n=1 Tax=Elizabethkingia meningoseptica TaxID=238 RepID=UPI0020136C00|nr:glycosyltransferase [Elizabethkingia meningoseptica]MCL1675699.1 glycosyltransferase [Elizabethkingia meningoseptica]MCL1686885.1 glycosyltransferase [Elizabethkingia meningoseptica]